MNIEKETTQCEKNIFLSIYTTLRNDSLKFFYSTLLNKIKYYKIKQFSQRIGMVVVVVVVVLVMTMEFTNNFHQCNAV